MVRKHNYASRPASPVSENLLNEARARLQAAEQRLTRAEHADPAAPGWGGEYAAAAAAVGQARRHVEAVEQLQAAQVERAGIRAKAAAAAAGELDQMAAALTASRDQVSAAAAAHVRALAELVEAAAKHNALLGQHRARLAGLGLRVRDDLLDESQEHAEGVLEQGLRAGGTDWTPVPADGLAAHALSLVFTEAEGWNHPLAATFRHRWRPHEVGTRPDGLAVPGLAEVNGMPRAPQRPVVTRLTLEESFGTNADRIAKLEADARAAEQAARRRAGVR